MRRQPPRRGQAADLRRDVLDQVAAGGGWRDHRRNLQGARNEARLRFGYVGLEDRLQRFTDRLMQTSSPLLRRRSRNTQNRKGVVQMPSSLSTLKASIARASIVKAVCAAMALLFVLAHPAAAQLSFKPTAEAVQEDKLLNALKEGDKISGRVSIPDGNAANLIQPGGRDGRDFHRGKLPWIGGIAILGMIALLAIFLMVRGRIRVHQGLSGKTILRFASFERFTHWLTASCFIILALSGLNVSFG